MNSVCTISMLQSVLKLKYAIENNGNEPEMEF